VVETKVDEVPFLTIIAFEDMTFGTDFKAFLLQEYFFDLTL